VKGCPASGLADRAGDVDAFLAVFDVIPVTDINLITSRELQSGFEPARP